MIHTTTDDRIQTISRAEARGLGLKHYFTGKPCKHGHVAERLVGNCNCVECGALASKDYRAANSEKLKTAYKAWREVHPDRAKAASKAWRAKNIDRCKAADKARYEENADRRKITMKAWRIAHPGAHKAATKAWRKSNAEKVRGTRLAWTGANAEKIRSTARTWVENNLDKVRASARAHYHVRRARKRAASGRWTPQDIQNILTVQYHSCAGCDVMFYEEQPYHIDHMIPLSRGGSNWPANLQILCPKCNCSKGTMTDEEWRASARFPKIASVFACT